MKFKAVSKIHILAFIGLFGFNFIALWQISYLDLFDFFSVLHKTINIFILILSGIMFASISTLFSLFYRFTQKDKENRQLADNNRDKLNVNLEMILSKLLNLELLMKNQVINNKNLLNKLLNVIKSVNFDDNFKRNAIFNQVFEKVAVKISDTYTLFKTEKKEIDYFSIEIIQKELKNILSANPNFIIDVESIINLSIELLKDFSHKHATKKEEKDKDFTKNLILSYFKVLITSAYIDYTKKQNYSKDPINKEYDAILQPENRSTIKGNDNSNIQDLKAETINVNINK